MTEVRGVNPDSDSPHWVELRYWKGQYAAEKERADGAEQKARHWESRYNTDLERFYQRKDELSETRLREKKLREAIDKAMDHIGRGNYNIAFYYLEQSVDPLEKEEEA